jgi:uncharacterized protein
VCRSLDGHDGFLSTADSARLVRLLAAFYAAGQSPVGAPIGYGVVARRLIPRGTITWVRDRLDQTFSPAQVQALPATYRDIVLKYCFIDGRGNFVLCWDLARYINHSCDPSCRSAGYDFEIAVRPRPS